MKICFMGSAAFSKSVLEAIHSKYPVSACYTKPPAEKGRGQKLIKSPVHEFCEANSIKVYTPKSFKKAENIQNFVDEEFSLNIVAAYGLIIPSSILYAPILHSVNIHASLLPRWRGAAPIERSIEAGDSETGITLMKMDEGLDTGDIIKMKKTPILPKDNINSIYEKLTVISKELILDFLAEVSAASAYKTIKQEEIGANYAKKILKEEKFINFEDTSLNIYNKIRAFLNFPGSFFIYEGETIKIIEAEILDKKPEFPAGYINMVSDSGLEVATLDGVINITALQRSSKKILGIKEFIKGFSLKSGIKVL